MSEANARLAKNGKNNLDETKNKTDLQRFVNQFKDVMITILLIAALDTLKNLSSPQARVLRDGAEKIISAEGLVYGDIIKFESSDKTSAAARLLISSSLKSEK